MRRVLSRGRGRVFSDRVQCARSRWIRPQRKSLSSFSKIMGVWCGYQGRHHSWPASPSSVAYRPRLIAWQRPRNSTRGLFSRAPVVEVDPLRGLKMTELQQPLWGCGARILIRSRSGGFASFRLRLYGDEHPRAVLVGWVRSRPPPVRVTRSLITRMGVTSMPSRANNLRSRRSS